MFFKNTVYFVSFGTFTFSRGISTFSYNQFFLALFISLNALFQSFCLGNIPRFACCSVSPSVAKFVIEKAAERCLLFFKNLIEVEYEFAVVLQQKGVVKHVFVDILFKINNNYRNSA